MENKLAGHVYILASPNTEYLKIGGSDFPPSKRLREINTTAPYRALGPWTISDFRQVIDWRKVEYFLHFSFRDSLVTEIHGAKELFRVALQRVSAKLQQLDPALIVKRPAIDRMFQDAEFSRFILRLFAFTGLMNWIDTQGAWVFVLFPRTGAGRYFTIDIGSHEVAFSTMPQRATGKPFHAIVMDRLICDFPEVAEWVKAHDGEFREDLYKTALPGSIRVGFDATFDEALSFLRLDGVRRALLAYWTEVLTGMKERNSESLYRRHHSWNAVAEIRARLMEAI